MTAARYRDPVGIADIETPSAWSTGFGYGIGPKDEWLVSTSAAKTGRGHMAGRVRTHVDAHVYAHF